MTQCFLSVTDKMPVETDISPQKMSSLSEMSEMSAVDEELADLAVDLVLLSQELVNTKLKLEHFTKVTQGSRLQSCRNSRERVNAKIFCTGLSAN